MAKDFDPDPGPPSHLQSELYRLALELTAKVFTVVELAEVERYYLRDALDKKVTVIPVLISRAEATVEVPERRELFRRARKVTADCAAILDILTMRGTVEPEVLGPARTVAAALIYKLDPLLVRW